MWSNFKIMFLNVKLQRTNISSSTAHNILNRFRVIEKSPVHGARPKTNTGNMTDLGILKWHGNHWMDSGRFPEVIICEYISRTISNCRLKFYDAKKNVIQKQDHPACYQHSVEKLVSLMVQGCFSPCATCSLYTWKGTITVYTDFTRIHASTRQHANFHYPT